MLCAKYDYKMDIAVKKEEAFQEGQKTKAVEDAILLVKDYNVTPEVAAEKMNAPLELVLEGLKETTTI